MRQEGKRLVKDVLMANDFIGKWAEALNLDPRDCQRVVIDAQVGSIVRVYVSKVGSEALLNVEPPDASGVNITVVGK